MSVFPILKLCLLVLATCSAVLHELPDGFVERGLAIVVREDFARIEYRIGASDSTMQTQLAEWKIDASKLAGEELHRCFADSSLARLPGEMRVVLDGKTMKIKPVEALVGGQHHLSAILTFDVPLADIRGLASLRLEDHSFGTLDGAIRLAIKSTGEVMTRNSRFAPLLVRAERMELHRQPETGRQLPVEIRARLVFPEQEAPQKTGFSAVKWEEVNLRLGSDWMKDDSPPPEVSPKQSPHHSQVGPG